MAVRSHSALINKAGGAKVARHGVFETDWDLFSRLDEEFHFTLDVCALPHNRKCARFISPAEDGLQQPWDGVCWCNPPYGQGQLKFWVAKAYQESRKSTIAVLLIPVITDRAWWHDYVLKADEVRFFRGCPKFYGCQSSPTPLCLVVFRPGCQGPPQVRSMESR